MEDDWKKLIPVSFGERDKCFALHDDEKVEAHKLLNAAIRDRVGFKEYTQTIRAWLVKQYSKTALQDKEIKKHIEKQMRHVRNAKWYFRDE